MEIQSSKTSLNIWGCCVSRDSVAFRQYKYVVPRFVQSISPFTVFDGKKILLNLENFSEYPEITNFCKRCICLDANKNAADYTLGESADWLLFDISEIRRSLFVWAKAGAILTKSSKLSRMLDVVNGYLGGEIPSEISPFTFSEEAMTAAVEKLCDVFLNSFPPERIIFHEFYNVYQYLDENDVLREFSESKKTVFGKENELIKRAAAVCRKKFSGCHMISMPDKTFADSRHRWGLSPLHYTPLYYDYAEKCISVILDGKPPEEEKERLAVLYELYNEKMLSCCMWARKNGYAQRVRQAESKLSGLRSLCEETGKKIAVLEDTNQELNQANARLSERNCLLERDNTELKDGIRALREEGDELRNNVAELNERCADLKHREEELVEEKAALQEENSRLGEVVCSQKNAIGEKTSELFKQKERCKKIENELNSIRLSKSYKLGRMMTWLPRKIRDKLKRR